MSRKDTGGAAFPVPHNATFAGMNLRDYFAGQALVGFLANSSHDHFEPTQWANDAYMLADAVLLERAR